MKKRVLLFFIFGVMVLSAFAPASFADALTDTAPTEKIFFEIDIRNIGISIKENSNGTASVQITMPLLNFIDISNVASISLMISNLPGVSNEGWKPTIKNGKPAIIFTFDVDASDIMKVPNGSIDGLDYTLTDDSVEYFQTIADGLQFSDMNNDEKKLIDEIRDEINDEIGCNGGAFSALLLIFVVANAFFTIRKRS